MYDIKLEKNNKNNGGDKKSADKARGKQRAKQKERTKDEGDNKSKGDEQKSYGEILQEISGSLKAVLLDDKDVEIKKIPVRELTDELKKSDNIATVVFDGIITQRLLDIASNKNVKEIVGIKMGNVVKMPSSVKVFTRKDVT